MVEIRTPNELRSADYNYFIALKLGINDGKPVIERAINDMRGKTDVDIRDERIKRLLPDAAQILLNDATYNPQTESYIPASGGRKREAEAATRFKLNEMMELLKSICAGEGSITKSRLNRLYVDSQRGPKYFSFAQIEREFIAYAKQNSITYIDDSAVRRLPLLEFDKATDLLASRLQFSDLYAFLGLNKSADEAAITREMNRLYNEYMSKQDRSLKTLGKTVCGYVSTILLNSQTRKQYNDYLALRQPVWKQLALRKQLNTRTITAREYEAFISTASSVLGLSKAESAEMLDSGLRAYDVVVVGGATGGEERVKLCPKCGAKNSATAKFCAECGHNFNAASKPAAPKPASTPKPAAPKPVVPKPVMPVSYGPDFEVDGNVLKKYKGYQKAVIVPAGIAKIDDHAFENCKTVEEIILPEGLTQIGNYALWFCDNLKKITLPKTLFSIGRYAFSACPSLEEIKIPKGVVSIEQYTFSDCKSLKKVTLYKGLTSIAQYAFVGCKSLEELKIPGSVTSIGKCAFERCSLREVIIPNSVNFIGEGAFNCSWFKRAYIPASVKTIEQNAFNGYNLTVYCQAPSKPSGWNYLWCTSRVTVEWAYVPQSNSKPWPVPQPKPAPQPQPAPAPKPQPTPQPKPKPAPKPAPAPKSAPTPKPEFPEGKQFNDSALTFTVHISFGRISFSVRLADNFKKYPSDTPHEIVIPETFRGYPVTEIERSAFENNPYIVSVVIPDSIKTIEENAFFNCKRLRSIRNITFRDDKAGWAYLAADHIRNGAFENCSGLKYLVLMTEYAVVSNRTFNTPFKKIYFNGTEQEWNLRSYKTVFAKEVYFYSPSKPSVKGRYWHWVTTSTKSSIAKVGEW